MRRRFTLDSTTSTLPVSLDFVAQAITVYNPTPNLVAVRIGSTGIPSSAATAEIWIGPYSAQSYPVDGSSYGLALLPVRSGTALATDALLPADVRVTFTAGEPAPDYSSVDFSTFGATEAIISDVFARPAGAYVDGPFLVPSWARTLIVSRLGVETASFNLTAGPTLRTMLSFNPLTVNERQDEAQQEYFAPWYPATETQVTVNYTASAAVSNGYQVRASRHPYAGAARGVQDGRQRVNVVPLGLNALPVAVTNPLPVVGTGAGPPLNVNPGGGTFPVQGIVGGVAVPVQPWPSVPAPTAFNSAFLVAPAAGAVVVVTAPLAAGDYRIEAEIASSDLPAVNKFISLRWNAGALGAVIHPCGGGTAVIVWSRVTVAAGDTFDAAVGALGAAGSLYSATIRAYRIG